VLRQPRRAPVLPAEVAAKDQPEVVSVEPEGGGLPVVVGEDDSCCAVRGGKLALGALDLCGHFRPADLVLEERDLPHAGADHVAGGVERHDDRRGQREDAHLQRDQNADSKEPAARSQPVSAITEFSPVLITEIPQGGSA